MTDESEHRLLVALEDVEDEVRRAMGGHPPLNSPHEGWAVIREELDELWEHARANTGRSSDAYNEATQTAAMALRYMVDVAERGEA